MIYKPGCFSISVAGIGVEVDCAHPQLATKMADRYREFSYADNVRLKVEITWIGKERKSSLLDRGGYFKNGCYEFDSPGYRGKINANRGIASLQLSSARPIEDIDYFLRVIYALLAFQAGGVMFHSAGIVRQGKAYLFFGHSGSGKTTVSILSPDDIVLNDDLLLLLPQKNHWVAFGTPFFNKTQTKPTAQQAPVAKLLKLVQANTVFLKPLEKSLALAEMTANIPVISESPDNIPALLARLEKLLAEIPIFALHFLPDDSFWSVIQPIDVKMSDG